MQDEVRPRDSGRCNRRHNIVRVRIQYTKPMSDSQGTPDAPHVSFGPAAPYDDISCTAVDGWTKTTYQNDTWDGECSIPLGLRTLEGENTLTIQSTDKAQFELDAKPTSVASYLIKQDRWGASYLRREAA